MTNDGKVNPMDLYNNSIETNSMREIEKQKHDVESKIIKRRQMYAEDYSVLIQSIMNTIVTEFNTMFPGAEAFIEGRIKSNNSIALKLKNKFQKAMNADNRKEAIGKIDLTDVLACSIVVTVPPKRFRTTDDKLNERLNDMAKGFEKTCKRVKEHDKYIEDNEEKVTKLDEEINKLKQQKNLVSKNGISEKMQGLFEDCPINDEELKSELYKKLAMIEMQEIQDEINSVTAQKMLAKDNIKYGQQNLIRTQETYDKELLELQRGMAYYFVENLANCQGFKILNTTQVEKTELKNKPGFVSTSSKYSVEFTNQETREAHKIVFEIQGKGEEDWKIAEFGKGASYHENQKSDEGQYSKQTYLPDFTIIGKNNTDEIEHDVRSEYEKLNIIELCKKSKVDLEQWVKENSNLDVEIVVRELEKVKKYVNKIQNKQDKAIMVTMDDQKKTIERDTDEYEKYRDIIEKIAESKIKDAYEASKEYIIQTEIEKRINAKIDKIADEPTFIKRIENSKHPLNSVYQKEIENITSKTKDDITDTEKVKHEARVKVLYYDKEQEIRKITKDIVPIYFWANILDNKEENSIVYYRSTGEAIYRYYYNRLHGLKKGDGYEENIEPQEQQRIALQKLTGLFEETKNNFFIYDKKENKRIDLSKVVQKEEGEER